MIDFNVLRISLQEWIVRTSGLPDSKVVFEDQASPRPAKPYISIKISTIVDIGQEDARGAIDDSGDSVFTGNREFTFGIGSYGSDALNTLSLIRDSLNSPTELQTLRDDGVVFVDQLLFGDVNELLETIWEERGQMDLLMRTTSTSTHQVGIVERVGLNGSYIAADGTEAVGKDTIITDPDAIAGTIISPLPSLIALVSEEPVIEFSNLVTVDDSSLELISDEPTTSITIFGNWDLNNAKNFVDSGSKLLDISGLQGRPESLAMSPDGTLLFVGGNLGNVIHTFTLSTPDDISSGTLLRTYSYTQGGNIQGIHIRRDGLKMWILNDSTIFAYTMTVAFDTSTMTYDSVSLAPGGGGLHGIYFNEDGSQFFICSLTLKQIKRTTMSTDWDISTTSGYDSGQLYSVSATHSFPTSVWFKHDGSIMYVSNQLGGIIGQWLVPTPFDLTSILLIDVSVIVSTEETEVRGVLLNDSGDRFYVTGGATDKVYQYTIEL